MITAEGVFEIERVGQTLFVTPLSDLRELDFQRIEAGATHVLHLLGNGAVKNVVLDFHKTDFYGSTALGFFVKLWKRVRERHGRMAFCRVSEHEKEIEPGPAVADLPHPRGGGPSRQGVSGR